MEGGPSHTQFFINTLAGMLRRRPLFLGISWVLNWPWITILMVAYLVVFHRHLLPPLSMAYVFAGVTIAITVAGVGAPLLSMMDPREAFGTMFGLRSVKSSVFRAAEYPEEYIDHPHVSRAFREAGKGPATQAQDALMKKARRTFETGLLALLVLPWIRHSHLGEWLSLVVPVSFALGTVVQLYGLRCEGSPTALGQGARSVIVWKWTRSVRKSCKPCRSSRQGHDCLSRELPIMPFVYIADTT